MNSSGLQAVLCDLDGTLVDTEPYWIAAEYAMVESFGGTWSDEHAHALVGNALLASAAYLREHGGVALSRPEIVAQLSRDVAAAAKARMPWRPGARELLAQVHAAQIPCALVTMSYLGFATDVCDQLPAGTFSAVVTGDQVVHGKPHPEPYLTAAERLDVDVRCCVAIEDSPTGIRAAQAAGCVVVAVPNHVPLRPGAGHIQVTSMGELDVASLKALVRSQMGTIQ